MSNKDQMNRRYMRTYAWELAAILNTTPLVASHYVWRMRAQKEGALPKEMELSADTQRIVNNHMERYGL